MSYYSCNNNRNSCSCNSCNGTLGSSTWEYSGSSCQGIGGQTTCGCGHRHNLPPFPPMNAATNTCPPGTRPCYFNPCSCGCGNCGNNCANNCGCGSNNGNNGTYAFFNSTGSTLSTGSVIPLRYVIGSGQLGRGTTGGVVNLDSGIYSVEYTLNATADTAGAIITVTPEYLGALHPEYARSFNVSTAGQTSDIAGSFVANLPTDTTLSLVVTITEPNETTVTTLTGVNASMLIRRISGCNTGCSGGCFGN